MKRKIKLLIRIVFILHSTFFILHSSLGQNIANYYDIKFNKLNIENGLPSNIVESILQDKQGFIWMATSNGLVRFDGIKTKIYQNIKSDSNSLPNNIITDMCIDSRDNIWLSTQNGIVKFIPSEERFIDLHSSNFNHLKSYRSAYLSLYLDKKERLCCRNQFNQSFIIIDTKTENLIAVINEETIGKQNWIKGDDISLIVDDDNFWFVVLDKGLFVVTIKNKIISAQKIKNNLNKDAAASSPYWLPVVDSKGNIYFAGDGLYFLPFNKKNTFKFEYIDISKGKKIEKRSDFSVRHIVIDREENVWVYTNYFGLKKYNPVTKEISEYNLKPVNYNGIESSQFYFLKDSKKNLWFKHNNGVLQLYNYESNTFQEFKHEPSNPNSLSAQLYIDNKKDKVLLDNSQNYWMLCEGVNYFSLTKAKFSILKNLPGNPNSLSGGTTWGIFEDNANKLWVGVTNIGLNIIDLKSGHTIKYLNNSKLEYSGFNLLTDIEQVSKNEYWLGSVPMKRFSFDNKTNLLKLMNEFRPDYNDSTSFSDWVILDIFKDSKENIWISTMNNGLNLYLKPDKTHPNGSFKHYSKNEKSVLGIANNQVWHIAEDKKQRLWISTQDGLSCMNKEQTKVTNFYHNPLDSNTISAKPVKYTKQDSKGNIWIATEGGGLNRYFENRNRFIAYNKSTGFPSDNIFAIFEDKSGNLWMSSTDGIIKYNPETNKSYMFSKEDGLQSKQFVAGSYFQNPNTGKMYFGGINGINHFYPDSIKTSEFVPQISFVSFKVFNKEIKVDKEYNGKIYITKAISFTDELTLSYEENVFSVEFAALDYSAPQNIKYSHMLEGVNKSWIETDADNRTLNYTNLAPGNYMLKVKSTNADGVWCENTKTLSIIVTPPFWQTWWFRVIVILLIISSSIAYYKYKTYKIKQKNQELERKVSERTNEVMQQKEELQQQAEELEATNEELTAQSDALKMSNEELNEKNEELNQKNEEIGKQKEEIEKSFKITQVISEFGQRVTSTFDLESINEIVYGYICSIMPTDAFGIGLFKEDKNEIEYTGFIREGQKIENFTKKLDSENSLTAWCFNNQKVVYVNDLEVEYSHYISALPNVSTNKRPQSIIHLPLSANERKLGIIVVNSFIKNAYTNKDLVHLQSLASYITIAIDNANAYKTVNAQKEKLLELDNFKEAMTGMIVHDLKNPLNAIIGLSSMNPEDEMMQMVNSAGNQMLNLVLNILDVQKFENTNVKLILNEASLYELADEANRQVSLLIKQKKQILNLNILPQTIIHTDAEVTIRVFVNMLTNAIKYTPSGGSISINQETILFTEDDYNKSELIPGSIKTQFKFQTPSCLISVSDTGQGIPADKLHLVFEKFGQVEAKKSGGVRSTGLGMTFCKMVVEAHGGAIWITSEVGNGTNFYLTLPFARNDQSIQNKNLVDTQVINEEIKNTLFDIYLVHENGSSEIILESDVASLENELKILVADDDKYSIDVIKNCLSTWGKTFIMYAVCNGKDAVDATKIIVPDIILLDWEMPQLDGLEALKQIKTIPELLKIPVAMVTSRSGNSHIQLAFDAGASDYIKKPIDKTEALFRIQTLVNLSQLINTKKSKEQIFLSSPNDGSALVLIVDDVFEIRQMIIQVLQNKYITIEAENGNEGLLRAKELLPDIIISDLNMPEMDGLELCKQLKENFTTSHIPVIMLTAQVTLPANIAGLEAGADAYLSKPIIPELLNAAVKNQIANREKLRKAFSKIITSEPSNQNFETNDEKFISQCIKTVEENIENPNFHIDMFVQKMSVSYSQLYGKIKYLTNLSVAGFIRNIRLKRAKQILDKEKLSLKELVHRVGFENVVSFKRIFKHHFGITPSEYAKKAHKND